MLERDHEMFLMMIVCLVVVVVVVAIGQETIPAKEFCRVVNFRL